MAGARWAAEDVELVNRVAAGPDLAPQLGSAPGGGTVGWGGHHPVDAALATLARDAVDLLNGPRTGRIKECEHADCSLLFFDDSQSGRRRWCSMDRCGNLVKIAGYRRRARH
jgi:predicted RNA-binding Zn ribbon-like protein